MRDVAAALGVHQTTVSLALRNHTSIPPATQERVRRMAEEMGYRPNPLVSALVADRKRRCSSGYGSTLAFLTSTAERGRWRLSHNYTTVYQALVARAPLLGYRLEEFWLHEPGMTPGRMQRILQHRGIRGIVVCPLPGDQRTLDFDFSEFAAVALGLTLQVPLLDRVAIDYHAVMNLAVQTLKEMGHRRLGFVTSTPIDSRVSHLPLGVFLAARHYQEQLFTPPFSYSNWDGKLFAKWLSSASPDAVITATPSDYDFLRRWLTENGYTLPEDLSLICLDCKAASTQGGIIQNLEAEAEAAIDLVTRRVERSRFGIPSQPQTIIIAGEWRDGALVKSRTPSDRKGKAGKAAK